MNLTLARTSAILYTHKTGASKSSCLLRGTRVQECCFPIALFAPLERQRCTKTAVYGVYLKSNELYTVEALSYTEHNGLHIVMYGGTS